MYKYGLLCMLLLKECLTIPPPVPVGRDDGNTVISRPFGKPADYWTHTRRSGFLQLKSKYVDVHGAIRNTNPGGRQIRVDATMPVSVYAHQLAATTVMRMTHHMPLMTFNRLAMYSRVGVFTKNETMVVYPEYARYANPPGCGASCAGRCNQSCTFDGRKYESLAGSSLSRAVVLEDNVVCSSADLYLNKTNVLVHEYAHAILRAMSVTQRDKVTAAYANARRYSLWMSQQYAMSNEDEYWAEASGTFFHADLLGHSTGGMNKCGYSTCTSESEARANLLRRDPLLYTILADIYTNNRPYLPGNIGPCTKLQI